MSAVLLEDVVKRHGAVTALDMLSLDVAPGELFGLIGPDGAGKTTAIRVMCGLLRADAGRVRVLGLDPVRQRRALTERVGYLSQRFSLYGDLTVDENLAFFADLHGVRGQAARRDRLLAMTGLAPFRGRLAGLLSGGMKQKLALACTLVHDPDLLLLDEPTTGVDPVSRREFWRLLGEAAASGITVLLSTPYLDEAERCGRIALVHEGRLLALDAPDRLRAAMPGAMFELTPPDPAAAGDRLAAAAPACRVRQIGDRLRVWVPPDPAAAAEAALAAAAARAGLPALAARRIVPTLEDVFIARLAAPASGAPARLPS